MVKKKIYVLGAGMSGLVAAYEYIKRGEDVTVIEKLDIPGGLSRTERYENYYVDSGPHLFHTSSQEIISYWESLFKDIFVTPALYGKNWVDGETFEYPLSIDSLDKLPPEVRNKIKQELKSRDLSQLSHARSYKEYMELLAGPTLQEIFYEEYPEKLWGISTSDLSPNWAPQRIEIRSVKKPFHADQWSGVAKLGCGQPMEILANLIIESGGVINYGEIVEGFKVDSNAISAIQTSKRMYELKERDIVISTLPIDLNSRLLGVECGLRFRGVKLVNVITDGDESFPADADWLYFKDKALIFHRVGLQSRFSKVGLPKGWSIMCCEIAYSKGDHIDGMSDQLLEEAVVEQLARVKLLDPKRVLKIHTMDLGPVYPGFYKGYEIDLQTVKGLLDEFSNFYFTGTLADFAYADFQVLCAKAIDLVEMIENPGSSHNRVAKIKNKFKNFSREVTVGKNLISNDSTPYIIAEIGLNHNGSVELAKKLIDQAVLAGCHAAKLQTFSQGRMSSKVLDARYNEDILDAEENLHQLFDRLIFNRADLEEIFEYAKKKHIELFSTPFDIESVNLLEELGVKVYKIASMDVVNLPLVRAVAKTMKPIIMSTGMTTLGDIEEAVEVIRQVGNPNLILLHCVSSYPCSAADSNLLMIKTLSKTFDTLVGFSDHFPDIYLVPPAVTLGARVIEKHITLDRSMKGPDHIFSLESDLLSRMVEQAAQTFSALGNGRKFISPSEYKSIQKLRRSIFAKTDIKCGQKITEEMLIIKSPGTGIIPKYMNLVLGRQARGDISRDHPITWDLI